MATHSSILAWRISLTEEPGELQSIGSQRIRHDWETNTHTHIGGNMFKDIHGITAQGERGWSLSQCSSWEKKEEDRSYMMHMQESNSCMSSLMLLLSSHVWLCHVRLFQPHELQHTRLSFPSLSPGICSNSCPLSQWYQWILSSLLSPSPLALNLSQHQTLFTWVSSPHQVAKYWSSEYQSIRTPRTDL